MLYGFSYCGVSFGASTNSDHLTSEDHGQDS